MTFDEAFHALREIWERLLKRSAIEGEDNFFQLGGTPDLAERVSMELAQTTHYAMPPVRMLQTPTLRALAWQISNPAATPCAPVLQMRGGDDPPIFIAHGIGGDALQLFDIALLIDAPNAIYATQARGIDQLQAPLDSVEEMSQFYFSEIRRIQPHGPYLLIGYSFGGLVMMELAQQLRNTSEKIALLAMLDSYPHWKHLSVFQGWSLLMQMSIRRAVSVSRAFHRRGLEHVTPGQRQLNNVDPVRAQIYAAELLALRRYQPRYYPGKVTFLRAATFSRFPEDPMKVWRPLVAEIDVETAPGDHTEMISKHAQVVAQFLTRHVKCELGR